MRDAGLQAERTALAWSRTVIAMLVNALVLLRAGLAHGGAEITAIGALMLAAAAALQVFARRRRRALMADDVPAAPPAIVLIAVAAFTVLAGAGGVLAIGAALRG